MTTDPVAQTIHTYDHIAANFAARWHGRDVLARDVVRFAELVVPGGLVLDVGCGPGYDTAVLRQHGLWAIGLDLSWGMMQAGRQRGVMADFVQADMRYLPVGATAVAGIWACASLLHLPREMALPVLTAFAHRLAPGGVLYVSLKLGQGDGWTAAPDAPERSRFFTYWQPETFDPLLIQAGFQIVDGWSQPGSHAHWLARLAQKPS